MHPNGRNGQESWLSADGSINFNSDYGRILAGRKQLMNGGNHGDGNGDGHHPRQFEVITFPRTTLDGSLLAILRLLAAGEVSQSQVRRGLGVTEEVSLAAALHPLLESWIFALEHVTVKPVNGDSQPNLELQLALKLKAALLAETDHD